jgi:prepilin-type N-terminal cleavage/methylation domain-containing protein
MTFIEHHQRTCPRSGLTLMELVISIFLVSILMAGLYGAIGTVFTAHEYTSQGQDNLSRVRYALDHMAMFVSATDGIVAPVSTSAVERLELTDCVLDTYTNATHAFGATGDNFLDADNDADGLLNESAGSDPADLVRFYLVKTNAANWLLMMERPDYRTANFDDRPPPLVLCENVSNFECSYLGRGLVEISLTVLDAGDSVTLQTRAKSRRMDQR